MRAFTQPSTSIAPPGEEGWTIQLQASVVREVCRYYTCDHMSIGAITRKLNERAVPTSTGPAATSGCICTRPVVGSLPPPRGRLAGVVDARTRRALRRRGDPPKLNHR